MYDNHENANLIDLDKLTPYQNENGMSSESNFPSKNSYNF